MSYKSIIVNLAVDAPPAPIVKVGVELAERFGARLIGLAAADVPPLVATGEGMVYEGEIMQIQRTEIEKRLAELRAEFERLVPASMSSEWGQAICSPTRFLSVSARAADLIVTATEHRAAQLAPLADRGRGNHLYVRNGRERCPNIAASMPCGIFTPRDASTDSLMEALDFLPRSCKNVSVIVCRCMSGAACFQAAMTASRWGSRKVAFGVNAT